MFNTDDENVLEFPLELEGLVESLGGYIIFDPNTFNIIGVSNITEEARGEIIVELSHIISMTSELSRPEGLALLTLAKEYYNFFSRDKLDQLNRAH